MLILTCTCHLASVMLAKAMLTMLQRVRMCPAHIQHDASWGFECIISDVASQHDVPCFGLCCALQHCAGKQMYCQ